MSDPCGHCHSTVGVRWACATCFWKMEEERDEGRNAMREVVALAGWGAADDCDCEICDKIRALLAAHPWLLENPR